MALANLGVALLPPKNCEQCGKSIIKKVRAADERFCSRKCFGAWLSIHNVGDANPAFKGGYLPYYGANWRQQRRNARHRDQYTCQRCGKTEAELGKALDVHHIKPFREFGVKHFQDANSTQNLVSLCPACHTYTEHHGWPS